MRSLIILFLLIFPFFAQLEDVFRRQLLQTEFLSKTYHKDYYAYFINTSVKPHEHIVINKEELDIGSVKLKSLEILSDQKQMKRILQLLIELLSVYNNDYINIYDAQRF